MPLDVRAKLDLSLYPYIYSLYKECTPRILVVTDGLSFSDTAGFGLGEFVQALKDSTIHGMTPIVDTELHTSGGSFSFTSSTLSIKKYDVLFLFGYDPGRGGKKYLPLAEREVIWAFMEAGGGVFGTGDHSTLGRFLCGGLPRVRGMRYWESGDVPSGSGTDRISTTGPGTNNVFEFGDQADAIPQKIYPTYYSTGASTSAPHALLQHPTKNVIEVLPDHPHEGICVEPTSYPSNPTLENEDDPNASAVIVEWGNDSSGTRVEPEVIALSMSYGGAFGSKAALIPKSFGAIGAYDGHRAEVGRVVVDATWHHFVNVNLIGSGTTGVAADADVYDRIQTYFVNIADWLMPKTVRKCLRFAKLELIRQRYPLYELLPDIREKKLDPDELRWLGEQARHSLMEVTTQAERRQLAEDILAEVHPRMAVLLRPPAAKIGRQEQSTRRLIPADDLVSLVLGSAVVTLDRLQQDERSSERVHDARNRDAINKHIARDLHAALDAMVEDLTRSFRNLRGFLR